MKEENEDIKKEETVNDAPENETENINAQEVSSGEGDAGENDDTAEKTEEKDPLTAAQEEIEQLKDKYLRSVAEFDNYRKRTLKEKAELILNGSEKAVQAILPVIDDMERAIANAEKTETHYILAQFLQVSPSSTTWSAPLPMLKRRKKLRC